jgi:DNA-binding MarR family transcriptional regulator
LVVSTVNDASAARPDLPRADPVGETLDVIHWQSAVLSRIFELLYRRTDIYDQLDRAEYLMLRILADKGPMDINTLASLLGLDPSTAGRQISAMGAAGLVERSPGPADRRRSVITPTGDGLRTMRLVRERGAAFAADLLADWTEDELRAWGALLAKYNRTVAERYLGAESVVHA